MQAMIGFWSHALAAFAFASILLWRVTRPVTRPGQALMLAALALTACWAWLSGIEPASALTRHAETARNLWLYYLNYYTVGNLGDGGALGSWRGVAMLLIAPLFALGAREDQGVGRISLSRSASFQARLAATRLDTSHGSAPGTAPRRRSAHGGTFGISTPFSRKEPCRSASSIAESTNA